MSPANANSLARSALKIGGGIGLATGLAVSVDTGTVFMALFCIVGTAAVMGGLGWSAWEHTPDGEPFFGNSQLTLRTLVPQDLPADVAAKLKETQR